MKNIFNKFIFLTIFILSAISLSSLKVNAMDTATTVAVANSNNQIINNSMYSDDSSNKYTSLIFFIEKDGKPKFIENKKEEITIRKEEIKDFGIKVRNKNKRETKGHDIFVNIGGEKIIASSWKIGNTPENQLEQKHDEMYKKLISKENKSYFNMVLIAAIAIPIIIVLFLVFIFLKK